MMVSFQIDEFLKVARSVKSNFFFYLSFFTLLFFCKIYHPKILKQVEDESARRMEYSLPGSRTDQLNGFLYQDKE